MPVALPQVLFQRAVFLAPDLPARFGSVRNEILADMIGPAQSDVKHNASIPCNANRDSSSQRWRCQPQEELQKKCREGTDETDASSVRLVHRMKCETATKP